MFEEPNRNGNADLHNIYYLCTVDIGLY